MNHLLGHSQKNKINFILQQMRQKQPPKRIMSTNVEFTTKLSVYLLFGQIVLIALLRDEVSAQCCCDWYFLLHLYLTNSLMRMWMKLNQLSHFTAKMLPISDFLGIEITFHQIYIRFCSFDFLFFVQFFYPSDIFSIFFYSFIPKSDFSILKTIAILFHTTTTHFVHNIMIRFKFKLKPLIGQRFLSPNRVSLAIIIGIYRR